jgi:hypothetical protein
MTLFTSDVPPSAPVNLPTAIGLAQVRRLPKETGRKRSKAPEGRASHLTKRHGFGVRRIKAARLVRKAYELCGAPAKKEDRSSEFAGESARATAEKT